MVTHCRASLEAAGPAYSGIPQDEKHTHRNVEPVCRYYGVCKSFIFSSSLWSVGVSGYSYQPPDSMPRQV